MILKLIWRNLWRNSRRTWITITSIAFAVLFAILMKSFQKGAFDNMIKNVISYYTGYIQIHKKGYWEEQILDNSMSESTLAEHKILQNPNIIDIVPRLESFILISNGNRTKGCFLVGTRPKNEINMTHLDTKISSGHFLSGTNNEEIVLAQGLSSRLNAKVNDTIVLFGQGLHGMLAAGKYKVAGIVDLASPEMKQNFAYLSLSAAQSLLSAQDKITSLSLDLTNPDLMNETSRELKQSTDTGKEIMTWQELMPEISNYIKADSLSLYMFTGILYVIIGFGLFGTVLMMTLERQFEFGMLISIGMKKSLLKIVLLGEALVITILGTVIGALISLPIIIYFEYSPIRFTGNMAKAYEEFGFEPIMPTTLDPMIFLYQSLVVLCLALLVGLYPIFYLNTLNPVEAMKH